MNYHDDDKVFGEIYWEENDLFNSVAREEGWDLFKKDLKIMLTNVYGCKVGW